MATLIWSGGASPIAQVTTITIAAGGGIVSGDTWTVQIGSKAVTTAVASTNTTTIAAAIQAALAALNSTLYPEFSGITWTTSTNTVIGTAKTAGVPFTLVLATSGAGSITQATGTAADGPNFWSSIKNWYSGGAISSAIPATGDAVIIQNSAVSILYGMAQSAVLLDTLTIDQSFSGTIGLPVTNSAGYPEYRLQYLQVGLQGTKTITIGRGSGAGSGRIKLDTGTTNTTVNVLNSGQPLESGVKSILWKGTHVSNTVYVDKGSFAAGNFSGDTVKLATLKVGFQTSVVSDSDVRVGPDCSQLTTITKLGGKLELNFTFTTLNQYDGGDTVIVQGTPGTILCTGGRIIYKTSGTLTAGTVGNGGEVDCSQDLQSVTFTNFTINSGGVLRDPAQRVAFTNPILINCALADCTLDLGNTFHLARS